MGPRAASGLDHRRRLAPYLYIAPSIALFSLLMLYPMVAVFRYSMLDGAILKPDPAFVWFDNFRVIFSDPVFLQSIGHTLYFSIMSVIFHIIVGLGFALRPPGAFSGFSTFFPGCSRQ